ncbi:hypothetical protein, partial [Blastomonas sp. UPD001]|uniref:hypothetical protein n=1 Tax=Blastomonas sp. UPD001 TaxID=2217673 RepID=UPI001E3C4C30
HKRAGGEIRLFGQRFHRRLHPLGLCKRLAPATGLSALRRSRKFNKITSSFDLNELGFGAAADAP